MPRSAQWESATRRAGVVEGLDQWRARLGALIAREHEESEREGAPEWLAERVDAGASTCSRFMEDFARLLAAHPERGTWAECLAALRRLVEEVVQDPDEVLGHLDQLAQLDELTGPVEFGHFRDTVRAEIRALKAGDLDGGNQGALGLRGVSVLDANALRHLRYRAVVVLGLTERSFPPPPRQDPLLLDDEREALNASAGLRLPLRARGPDQEPLQFALAAAAARERLLLTTRRAAEAGARPQLPSSFFREAASALAGRTARRQRDRHARGRVLPIPAGRETRSRGSGPRAHRAGAGHRIDRARPGARDGSPRRARAGRRRSRPTPARAVGDRELTTFDGIFENADAVAAVGAWLDETSPLSPTVLEAYATCPYRFFLDRLLRAKPLDEPEAIIQLDPLTRGNVIHDVLEEFLAAHTADDLRTGNAPTLHAQLRAIAERVLEEVEAAGLAGAPITWRRERTEIVDDLARWLEKEIADPGTFPSARVRGCVRRDLGRQGREPALDRRAARDRRPPGRPSGSAAGSTASSGSPASGSGSSTTRAARNRAKGMFDGGRALQLALYLLAAAKLVDIDVTSGTASYEFVTRRGSFTLTRPRGSGPRRPERGTRRGARPDRRRDRRAATSTTSRATSAGSVTSMNSATFAVCRSRSGRSLTTVARASPR